MEEAALLNKIKQGDESSFEMLFRQYYKPLCGYAKKYLEDSDLSEEIVQNLFCKFWEKREQIDIHQNAGSYLYGAVRNLCLNEIRGRKTRQLHHENIRNQDVSHFENDAVVEVELDQRIEDAIQNLPEASRKAFMLSRVDGLKYADIAVQLGISVKAVEANISRALKKLRVDLKDYLVQIILWWWIG